MTFGEVDWCVVCLMLVECPRPGLSYLAAPVVALLAARDIIREILQLLRGVIGVCARAVSLVMGLVSKMFSSSQPVRVCSDKVRSSSALIRGGVKTLT